METISITRDDFRDAVSIAVEKTVIKVSEDHHNDPMATLLIPMTGITFSKAIEAALFENEEELTQEG